MEIKALTNEQLDLFVEYLIRQIKTNGMNGEALYLPIAPGKEYLTPAKVEKMKSGVEIEIGQPGWRRYWVICDDNGDMIAHIDLRSRDEPNTAHRALLGMGMDVKHRGKGIGSRLVKFVLDWAKQQPAIEWVDLQVMNNNVAGVKLYQKMGFELQGRYESMFCIDSEFYNYLSMTRRV